MTEPKFKVIQGGKDYAPKYQVLATGVHIANIGYVQTGLIVIC